MYRTVFTRLAIISATVLAWPFACIAEPSVYPTGVTRYDPARAYNSYVIFAGPDRKTHLIDMNGNEVHRWDFGGFPTTPIDPALTKGERGHVLVQLEEDKGTGTAATPGDPAIFRNKTVGELDWQGRVVWQWGAAAPGGAARQHHDQERLANGDTLLLVNIPHQIPGFALKRSLDDAIREVTPDGRLVWSWIASQHLEEFGFTPDQLKLVKDAATPDYLHLNDMRSVGPNKWFDAGDKRFAPDNIIIDSRNANFVAIIEKATGKVVWRLGPTYAGGDADLLKAKHRSDGEIDQISGQHDAHLIPKGLPGAGNLLVFDNQGEGGYPPVALKVTGGSRILEINPQTHRIVWFYSASLSGSPDWTFYSSFISDARRLPNGNTFIDEGMNGRFFQVTPKGEIVWEYVSPFVAKGKIGGGEVISNWVYRAEPVRYDWAPAGTARSERPVAPPPLTSFHVPTSVHVPTSFHEPTSDGAEAVRP